ncbi:SDR family oxidoreductase [Egibacter rhizosphaerae]|uniref:SDR family oxidoreductase n=1 Tax=Egibacter rhizosphaerae TaxID=1670831 RepID=A0A411YDY5_9ACTN|nr:SDR family oxidoreductase [Egibacter rhizosphaerae]QBI19396.1 SDR family oxidoreductase [Egibacter rhizosphaerae]
MSDTDLEGRAILVTGAGGGLGRSHALLLAERGARVLVNDLGGDLAGQGQDPSAAEAVAAEITDAGGEAEADNGSVASEQDAVALVQRALDRFGRLDGIVNNAGILRDRSFAKMTREEFDAVLDVHLRGTFNVTSAAWPHLREQASGAIVNTTSGAGLFGNFGQANYSAAKMGIVGLTRTLAIEGARYGIRVNAVSPIATSRMTETILSEEQQELLAPEYVSPVVAYLLSDACRETGAIVAAGGGHVARVAVAQGDGVQFDRVPTPDEVADHWGDITTVNGGAEYRGTGAAEQTERLFRRLSHPAG